MRLLERRAAGEWQRWSLPLLLVMSIPFMGEPRRGIPEAGAASSLARTSTPRAVLFLSANTDENLTLNEAQRRLTSPRQQQFRRRAEALAAGAGLHRIHVTDSLGDWSDGAENSLLVQSNIDARMATLREVAARFGLEARQKSVLVFRADRTGRDQTAFVDLPPLALSIIRHRLDEHEIAFRTIIPTRAGYRVVVLDMLRQSHARIEQATKALNGRVRFVTGESITLGDDDRVAARRQFLIAIREAEHDRLRSASGSARDSQRQPSVQRASQHSR